MLSMYLLNLLSWVALRNIQALFPNTNYVPAWVCTVEVDINQKPIMAVARNS